MGLKHGEQLVYEEMQRLLSEVTVNQILIVTGISLERLFKQAVVSSSHGGLPHQIQPSSLHVLSPHSGRVSCSVYDAFIS